MHATRMLCCMLNQVKMRHRGFGTEPCAMVECPFRCRATGLHSLPAAFNILNTVRGTCAPASFRALHLRTSKFPAHPTSTLLPGRQQAKKGGEGSRGAWCNGGCCGLSAGFLFSFGARLEVAGHPSFSLPSPGSACCSPPGKGRPIAGRCLTAWLVRLGHLWHPQSWSLVRGFENRAPLELPAVASS
jgi:hypothetical protein